MENVLVDERLSLGVVDWEHGQGQGWPLADFFYALADATMTAQQLPDRLRAVEACFTGEGAWAATVARWQARMRTAAGLSAGQVELCFHACWLRHAVNEQRAAAPEADRPFLAVVQWLALNVPSFTSGDE
jgi:hypothetical protein